MVPAEGLVILRSGFCCASKFTETNETAARAARVFLYCMLVTGRQEMTRPDAEKTVSRMEVSRSVLTEN